jgi:hypothetical protein
MYIFSNNQSICELNVFLLLHYKSNIFISDIQIILIKKSLKFLQIQRYLLFMQSSLTNPIHKQ